LTNPTADRGRTLHVAQACGDDANDGAMERPFKTISAAARVTEAGDTVLVHAGTYRERVDPPRGGSDDLHRITYLGAPGEQVTITGSDPAKGWTRVQADVWTLVVPNASFGAFNPYIDEIRGDWFDPMGRTHHTGCVYLDGEWLVEAPTLEAVMQPADHAQPGLWFAEVEGDTGSFLMNLAQLKPANGGPLSAGEPSFRYGGRSLPSSEGGTCSGYVRSGHTLRFDDVDFGAGSEHVDLRASAPPGAGGVVELRIDTPDGAPIGLCQVDPTGSWSDWRTFTAQILPTSGKGTLWLRFASAGLDAGNTVIHAQFPGVDPNDADVEINTRQTVFYPSRHFVDFITVSGFTMLNAATNWAPPSAEQPAVIGTNWSKGWIIQNNEIAYSKCSGVSFGKYGDGTDNTNDAGAADPFTACVERALERGWDETTVGSHLVRDNVIHHCEQAGIVGSLGCAFSRVERNDISSINSREMFTGAEQAGIKFHGFVDGVIADNHIHHVQAYGIWLDWMGQGAQVTGNLLHDNVFRGIFEHTYPDIFCEMQHGPVLIANNILLSPCSLLLWSKGVAMAHNLLAGELASKPYDARRTPFHQAHSTAIAGLADSPGGDHRFHNNLGSGRYSGHAADSSPLPCFGAGGVYVGGATPPNAESGTLVAPGFDAKPELTRRADGWYLSLAEDPAWRDATHRSLVTTQLLGKATIPDLPYENADGTPVTLDTDYFGTARDLANPFPGPFEAPVNGEIRVWPKQDNEARERTS
jgi:hypothetical protein